MNSNSCAELITEVRHHYSWPQNQGEVLSARSERTLFRFDDEVIKIHARETLAEELDARLELISRSPWNQIFLQPIKSQSQTLRQGRIMSQWPFAEALTISEDEIPWHKCGKLLAELHQIPIAVNNFPFSLPIATAAKRWQKSIAELKSLNFIDHRLKAPWLIVEEMTAKLTLPKIYSARTHWIHGDWHLGQLVREKSEQKSEMNLKLIDIEDMGLGHPVWDLARPGAFYAAGLLDPEDWSSFLNSYLTAGGPAFQARRNETFWEILGPAVEVLSLQCAAVGLRKAYLEERSLGDDEQAFIETCARILRWKNTTQQDKEFL